MKKFLSTLLLLVPLTVLGQVSSEKNAVSVEKNSGLAAPVGYLTIQNNGTAQVQESIFDIIPGSNITITCVDDGANTRTKCTFASTAGGGVATDSIWTAAGQLVVGTGNATAHVIGSGTGLLHQSGAADPTWSTVATGDVAASAITYAKIQNETNATVLGNDSGGAAAPSELTLNSTLVFPSTTSLGRAAITGDVSVPAASNTATIQANVVTNADLAQGAAHTVVGVTGNATANRGDIAPSTSYLGSAPQVLGYNGTTTTAFVRQPWDTTTDEIINRSFDQVATADGAAAINGSNITVTGTSAGYLHTANTATDANHLNFVEMTTGTTTTGGATIGAGQASSGFLITGGEVIDWLVDIPVLSGATNTFRCSCGFGDTIGNTAISNGAFVTVDANSNANWAVETIKASSATGPTASTTAQTTGWHHLTTVVNSNATSIAFYVDGTQLSSSPLTTNLPTTVKVFPMCRIVASAGCAATSTCVMDVNTEYFHRAVSR